MSTQEGRADPVIDTTFLLEAIAGAQRHLEAGGQVGKIVVTVPAGAAMPTRHKVARLDGDPSLAATGGGQAPPGRPHRLRSTGGTG